VIKLFYVPNTCAIAPHIAMAEAQIPFSLELVDLKAGKKLADGSSYFAVNPKGYVPALKLDDGEVLSEVQIVLQYIADLKPEAKLAPAPGTMERLRLNELLAFISTELHKAMSPLYQPYTTPEFKAGWIAGKVDARWQHLNGLLEGREFVFGQSFTVADAYAFYVLRSWTGAAIKGDLSKWKNLEGYWSRMNERPSVKAGVEAHSRR
jgi:glutathione S-transferase